MSIRNRRQRLHPLIGLLGIGILTCRPSAPPPFQPVAGRLANLSFDDQRSLPPHLIAGLDAGTVGVEPADVEPLSSELSKLRSAALGELWSGDVEGAERYLLEALELEPGSAILHNDHAVIRLQRAEQRSSAYDVFLALRSAVRARQLTPNSLAAQFNEALAWSRLPFPVQANNAWDTYLQSEVDDAWRREAKGHLRQLEFQPVAASDLLAALESDDPQELARAVAKAPRLFREHTEETLLPKWAQAMARGSTQPADRLLQRIREVSRLLHAQGGDPSMAQVVAQIDGLPTTGPSIADAVASLVLYGQGMDDESDLRIEDALESYNAALLAVGASLPALAPWVRLRIARCHYQHSNYGSAKELLRQLERDVNLGARSALRGRAAILLGNIQLIEGDPAAAIGTLEGALGYLDGLREGKYAAKAKALIANGYDYLGQREMAWNRFGEAMQQTEPLDDPIPQLILSNTGAWLALQQDAPEVALRFQDVSLQSAEQIGLSTIIVDALRSRADILQAMGQWGEADQALRAARDLLDDVSSAELLQILHGDLAFLEAQDKTQPPDLMLTKLSEAIHAYSSTSYSYRTIPPLLERAKQLMALQRPDEAEQDLDQAIAESERQRASIPEVQDRVDYFDQMRDLLDTMVQLQRHQLRQPQRALAFSERSKARALWDWQVQLLGPDETIPSLQDALGPQIWHIEPPPSTTLVTFAVLQHGTIAWVLRTDQAPEVLDIDIEAESLAQEVELFREALRSDDEEHAARLGSELYDLLLRPLWQGGSADDSVVIVPDRLLHSLPFAMLRNRNTGRLVLQDRVVSLSPSLGNYAATQQRTIEQASTPLAGVLFFTSPAFDSSRYPLAPLGPGLAEADVAHLFDDPQIYRREEATPGEFLDAVQSVDVFHFGGHSLGNPDYPLRAHLLMAPDALHASGVLYAEDFLQLDLSNLRLAVLASCESGLGSVSATEGNQSLARAFQAAGTTGVLASLWPVENQATEAFFTEFYSQLVSLGDAALALQYTQQAFLHRGVAPSTWGAFVLHGESRLPKIKPISP